jgi:hypothetical protein
MTGKVNPISAFSGVIKILILKNRTSNEIRKAKVFEKRLHLRGKNSRRKPITIGKNMG